MPFCVICGAIVHLFALQSAQRETQFGQVVTGKFRGITDRDYNQHGTGTVEQGFAVLLDSMAGT